MIIIRSSHDRTNFERRIMIIRARENDVDLAAQYCGEASRSRSSTRHP
jgi:hypothetical protein